MTQTTYELMNVGDRLIMDPVHGGITLFDHEMRVVDHPLFQRLRSICQNDILSLVFPGATHSRFLHSIGTLHIGHRIFRALIENCLRVARRSGRYRLSSDYLNDQQSNIVYFNKVVRLACLLHDIGHSSFSHQFSKATTIRKILCQKGVFESLWKNINFSLFYRDIPDFLEHEHYSVRCAYEILKDDISEIAAVEVGDVLALMETTTPAPSDQFTRHAESIWPLLTGSSSVPSRAAMHVRNLLHLIVSGEIDADRADYMLRDGFHSSVTLGGFSLDHLLKNLRVGWDEKADWMGMAITQKGLGALEDFVYSRHQLYRKVYGHKTSIGFDWILRKAIDEVLADDRSSRFIRECLTDINSFRHLTDYYFWEQFRSTGKSRPDSYSAMMIDRKRLKPLHRMENVSAGELHEKKQKVADYNGISTASIVTCELKTKFSEITDQYEEIKVLNFRPLADNKEIYYSYIAQESQFFEKFRDGNIVHFYLKPNIQAD